MSIGYEKSFLTFGLVFLCSSLCGCRGQQSMMSRPQPNKPDGNFNRVLSAINGRKNPETWNSLKETEFVQLISLAESLKPHAQETAELKREFSQLLLLRRIRLQRGNRNVSLPDTFVNSVGITMKLIKPGKFMRPVHEVEITRPFYLGVYEITGEQYASVMGESGGSGPKVDVSWHDAMEFCKKLSRKEGLTYSLPTEAQWEYACRASTQTKYSFGNSWSESASRQPNAWGLYDMHGNVWEWCSDWYGKYANADSHDPQGLNSGLRRVLRGGSWRHCSGSCRSAGRAGSLPDDRCYYIGFRVVVVSSLDTRVRQAKARTRKKEAAFASLMSKARSILLLMPSDKKRLSALQKSDLRKALQSVQAALTYKPADASALSLKARINKLLEGF